MNQNQLAELFDTSKQNIGRHISNVLNERELKEYSVVKNYFTTAADGKKYEVIFYSLDLESISDLSEKLEVEKEELI